MVEDDEGNAIEPDAHWLVWAALIATLPFILLISLFTLRSANGD